MLISNNAYAGVELLRRLTSHEPIRPCGILTLAGWINTSVECTEILLAPFCQAGLVEEAHGAVHGYQLSRPADQISIAEILKALDEPRLLRERPLNAVSLEPEGIGNLYGTDLLWEALKKAVLLFLSGITLDDVASDREFVFDVEDESEIDSWHDAPSFTIH